jgi:phage-related protein
VQQYAEHEPLYVATGVVFEPVGESCEIVYTSAKDDTKRVPVPNYFYKVVLRVERDSSGEVVDAEAIGFWFEHRAYSDKYYNYAIYNQIDFARLIRFKTAEVTFHVQPFKFSDVENARTFNISGSSEIQVRNNGNYFSRPTISISGFGIVDMYINGTQLLTLDLGNTRRTIIIDSTELNAYNEDKTLLLNRLVSGDYDNIRLKVGNNSITFTGSVFQVVIENYSRWI